MKKMMWVRIGCVMAAVLSASIAGASDLEIASSGFGKGVPSKGAPATVVHQGKVTRIVDGDTIRFVPEGAGVTPGELKIRMVNIDAPESHFPTDAGPVVGQQPWGQFATDALKALITDPENAELEDFGLDKYGRTLGRLYIKGQDINLAMVRSGMAFPYPICADADCTPDFFQRHHVDAYVAACEDAQDHGRGVHNPRKPLTEAPYLFRLRMNNKPASKFVGDLKTRRLYAPDQYNQVPICSRVFFLKEEEANAVGYYKSRVLR